jgi:hypothetical protein
MRGEGWLPRATTANVIGVILFLCFVGPAVLHPPFPLPRARDAAGGAEGDASTRAWTGGFVQVAKNSHAYLQPLFPGHTEASFGANVSAAYSEYIARHGSEVRWEEGLGRSPGSADAVRVVRTFHIQCSGGNPSRPSHPSPPSSLLQLKDQKSFMHDWIQKDLEPWKDAGITLVRVSVLGATHRRSRAGWAIQEPH